MLISILHVNLNLINIKTDIFYINSNTREYFGNCNNVNVIRQCLSCLLGSRLLQGDHIFKFILNEKLVRNFTSHILRKNIDDILIFIKYEVLTVIN